MLAFAYSEEEDQNAKGKLKKYIGKSLDKLHHQVVSNADHFTELEVTEQHTEPQESQTAFVTALSLYRAYILVKMFSSFLKQLQPVQNTLGLYNDLFIAEDLFNKSD